jgi:hypothetical protein
MYIPVSYFSTRGACITTTTSITGGSGIITSGSFYSSSQVYNWLKFEMSNLTSSAITSLTANLTISTGSTQNARIVVVGGGGSGTTTGSFVEFSQTYIVGAAAGGGGGGVVQYTNFPLSPGVYEIGVGAAVPQGNTTFLTGSRGNNSYFKNIFAYTPFSTPFITAEGGGTGNIRGTVNGLNGSTRVINGANGGSGGGSCMTFRNAAFPAYQAPISGTLGLSTLGGLTNGPQGFNGGNYMGGDANTGGGNDSYGVGGGGAGGVGPNAGVGTAVPSDKGTDGGPGITINMSGSSVVVSGGGAGAGQNKFSGGGFNIGTRGSTSYGAGGNGNLAAGGTTLQRTTIGNAGVVYIEWPLCIDEYSNCTQYNVLGGAAGGTVTYIPCGTTTITSSVVEADTTSSLCTKAVLSYPSTTGTVSLSEVGNCNEFIPLPPQVTCPISGTIKTALNVYNANNTGSGICYPTPSYCARLFYQGFEIYYYDENNVLKRDIASSGFSPSYLSVCAKNNPAPFISSGGSTFIQKSAAVCDYYCQPTSSNQLTTNGLVLQVDTTSLTGSIWYDRSGNGNNGLVSGSTLSLSGSLGYAFNGTNNYLTFPTNLTATPSSSYSIQWWGSSFISSSTNYFLFSKGGYANGWDTLYRPNDKSLVFRDTAGGDQIYVTNYNGGNKALFTVNVTTNDFGIGSFYFNKTGSLDNMRANAFNSSSVPLRFGFNVNSDGTLFKGTAAGLTVYNRMLTPEEIENNYNYYFNNF